MPTSMAVFRVPLHPQTNTNFHRQRYMVGIALGPSVECISRDSQIHANLNNSYQPLLSVSVKHHLQSPRLFLSNHSALHESLPSFWFTFNFFGRVAPFHIPVSILCRTPRYSYISSSIAQSSNLPRNGILRSPVDRGLF